MSPQALESEVLLANQALAEAEAALDVLRRRFDAALNRRALSAATRKRRAVLSAEVLAAEIRASDCRRRAHEAREAVEMLRAAKVMTERVRWAA